MDAANSAAADAATAAPAAQSLSELVPVPSGAVLDYPDAPFKLRPYQVDAIRSIISSWKGGNNAQMVMLPTGCGKTVVFSALSRYMSQHYVAPAPASDTATPVTTAGSSSTPPAPSSEGGSAQGRGSPTVAAAVTGDSSASRAAQAAVTEEDAVGSSSRKSSSTHAESTSSAASDEDENTLVGVAGRFQRLQQAATHSPGGTGAPSTLHSQQQSGSSESSSIQSSSRAGRQAAAGTNSSRSTPTLSTSSSSLASSSSDDDSGGGSMRGQPLQQQLQQQLQQAEVAAPAGSMRVLVLAHRHELLHQAEEKFRLMGGSQDLSVSWVKGKRKEFDGQVVIASVKTAANCIPKLRDCGFSLVIIDEAHHAVASSYKTILEGLGLIEEVVETPTGTQSTDSSGSPGSSVSSRALSSFDEAAGDSLDTSDSLFSAAGKRTPGSSQDEAGSPPPRVITRVIPNPHQLLLGFTATPYRRLKRESEDLYAILRPTYTASISTMIRDNFLTEVNSRKIMTQTDLQGVALNTGDFVLRQLSPLVNSRSRNKLVLASYLEQCTAEDPQGEAARTPEQQRQHEILSRERARQVAAELQKNDRKKEARAEEKRRAASAAAATASSSSAAIDTSDSSDDDDSDGEEEREEEEGGEVFPLPPDVTPEQLTGGLSMAGRRAVRRTIAFAVDIRHAEAMNAVFNAAGVFASAVHSLMPHDTMKQELARFRAGELDVLFNVEVLTEGFDEPAIDAILMARPTRSAGLYTQMLGRGLRIMPGKKDCLVLDFTDKYHQAGAVVDVRVLLDDIFGPKRELPQEPNRGPARIDEDAQGGQVDLLDRGIDPKDLAWRNIGPHCITSIFSAGNVWLVNVAGMGPTQRASLGLVSRPSRSVLQGKQQQQRQDEDVGADRDADEEDSDDEEDSLEGRYVILHQDQGDKDVDPSNWKVAYTPHNHTWRGFSKEDAYGTALTYIDTYVRTQQAKFVAQFVRAKRSGQGKPKAGYPHLSSYKQDAPWRGQLASDKQLEVLKRLGIAAPDRCTKGEASDLISAQKCSLAEPAQRARLQGWRGEDLPVPLLKAHADKLLADGDKARALVSAPGR